MLNACYNEQERDIDEHYRVVAGPSSHGIAADGAALN